MDRSELISMTVKALRERADALGIKRLSSLKKAELVDAIIEAEKKVASSASKSKGSQASGVRGKDKAAQVEAVVEVVEENDVKNGKSPDPKSDKTTKAKQASKSAAKNIKKVSVDGKVKDDVDERESVDEADEADEKVAADALEAEKKAAEEDEADKDKDVEAIVEKEPDSVFIDRGAVLPEYVPGTCLYALVRDPGTVFVYWNAEFESVHGWLLTAYDTEGNVLQSFSSPARRNGRGYFRVPSIRVARVTLAKVEDGGASRVCLESRIRLAQQSGFAPELPGPGERWVDVQNHEVVYEAPAPGRAPEQPEVVQTMQAPFVGGGYDRSMDYAVVDEHGTVSTSSRFGSLSSSPSSDSLVGSSHRIVRH